MERNGIKKKQTITYQTGSMADVKGSNVSYRKTLKKRNVGNFKRVSVEGVKPRRVALN